MQIIPAIDLKDGRCVRLSQGQKDSATAYDDDPVEVAKRFAESGAEIIHVVDLDGAFNGQESSNRSIVKTIAEEVRVPIQFGGGLRTLSDVRQLIDGGISRVILGTVAIESVDTLKALIDHFGSKICVGIDARDGVVMTHGWEQSTNRSALDLARAVVKMGIQRIVYTDIKRDGMLTGPNIEQTIALARATGVQVTASGGISSLEDLERLREANEPLVDSVIVGKALYERKFTLEEALNISQ